MPIKEREELLFQKLREKDPDIVADGTCGILFMRVEDHRHGIILHAGRKEFYPGKKNFRGLRWRRTMNRDA